MPNSGGEKEAKDNQSKEKKLLRRKAFDFILYNKTVRVELLLRVKVTSYMNVKGLYIELVIRAVKRKKNGGDV